MAQKCAIAVSADQVRVLDPAAGAGVLAAAVVEALLNKTERPSRITVTLFEMDGRWKQPLKNLANRMRRRAESVGVSLSVSIRCEDFLLSHEAIQQQPVADIIIANPPYFKLRAHDPRSLAHAYAVHGQPNIYGLFMAACSSLVESGGSWCFITPRSWTNGAYFAAMRRRILCNLSLDAIHVFESRIDHFSDDDILQEAMITWASARAAGHGEVLLSTSHGSQDLTEAALTSRPVRDVIGGGQEQLIALRNQADPLDAFTATFETYGFKVSTGPVVAFRAKSSLRTSQGKNTVPMLWMQHIERMRVQWPRNKKQEHIAATASTAWMLVQNAPLVVLRRFSPKEDQRRVTAAAYVGGLPGAVLGLENHLNYIYRPGGSMTASEALGVSAYLNSRVVDAHFRAVAGSTQVNAAELRKLPLPSHDVLLAIGAACRPGMSLAEVDSIVESVLGFGNRSKCRRRANG